MLVADASAIAEVILAFPRASAVREVLARANDVHVPEHFHVEVLSAFRGAVRRRAVPSAALDGYVDQLCALRAHRHAVLPQAREILGLRDQLTSYDAAYLALALKLGAPLVTLDRALARSARRAGLLAPGV